ncbi:MAG TPA: hypothetical protein VFP80_06640 [Thermoanaerobaculia bacterium]|nr:hypothetical protein [Thermoanaerobaculia bacterium]
MTTTMAQPATRFVQVAVFWIAAAVLVVAGHAELDRLSPAGGAVATIAAIAGAAYAYTRLCARYAGISHALGVGIAWLVLTIIAEVAISTRAGHGWYSLIGTPDRPLLRSVFLFVWVFAPALFARREAAE